MSHLDPELISEAEFARRAGCDRVIVQRAVKRGILSKVNGLFDAALLDRDWRKKNRRTIIREAATNGATSTATKSGATSARTVADIRKARMAAYDAAYPRLAQVRDHSPPKLSTMMESIVGGPDELMDHLNDGLLDLFDLLAWSECEDDAQAGEWHRWPSKIAASLAAEIGVPDKAAAIESGLRSRIVARLEHELMIDPDVYLTAGDQALSPAQKDNRDA